MTEHGTTTRYRYGACRCTECCAAATVTMREYRADPLASEKLRDYRREHRQRPEAKLSKREAAYRRTYGFSVAEYDQMLAEQGGLCAICRTDTPNGPSRHYFLVDHDHQTGKVRGLLCGKCNTILGYLDDDSERAHRLIAYLERGE